MVAKFAMILMFAGACLAYPAEEELAPPAGAPVGPPQPVSDPNAGIGAPVLQALSPPQGPPEGKAESDLKTDSSFWFRRSYYPVYYARSYYRPRVYYYSYPSVYSYWNSWW
ncbi:uncharacterized protein LOC126374501 [Pectinophora gossypiella]|uniref:uncharacterized protein LOC126374501 n=1 Tax=Pectinophora gossypiella TaxID=13191 RepID=UPI00214E98D2|nr:uncharacterized protein LOC126374501 [Pectinophora gossypiella]